MRDAGHAGHAHRVGHQAQRADPLHHLARAEQVDGIGDGRAQHEQRADHRTAGPAREVVHEHQHDAAVGQGQRAPLQGRDAALQENGGDRQHEGRREKQDQAFEPDRDVLQPQEIEVARQVVTDEPEPDDAPAVSPAQRGLRAHLPDRHASEHRKREQHSEGDQCYCVDVVAIQQFGDHGFRGKQDGPGNGDGEAADEGSTWYGSGRCAWRGLGHPSIVRPSTKSSSAEARNASPCGESKLYIYHS